MKVTLLSDRSAALADVLRGYGWEHELAAETAGGVASVAFHVSGIGTEMIEGMLPVASRLGIQMISGPDWLLLVGPHSRLGAFARPWVQPEVVQPLAIAIGMTLSPPPAIEWRHRTGTLALEAPVIMGILNATPDSFSDGGVALGVDAALRHADSLIEGGAGIIDVGGESTRPGADPVPEAEERARVVPVIEALARRFPGVPLSVDTVKSGVAQAALDAGASIVNDVTAGRHDQELLRAGGRSGAGMVLSHSRGPLETIARLPEDGRPVMVGDVVRELRASWDTARVNGVIDDRIVLDPGIGFGKDRDDNLRLVNQLDALAGLGRPVLVGASRKRFLGEITGREARDRDAATAALCALAVSRGAAIVRVHHPAAVRDAVLVAAAARRV